MNACIPKIDSKLKIYNTCEENNNNFLLNLSIVN